MARVAIPHIALKPDPANANALVPATGASVAVRRRADNALVTVYQAETGAATVANPLASDANGRVAGWVDRGAYTVTITGTGITMPPDQWDAAPAGDNSVDAPWIAGAALPVGSIFTYAGAGDPAGGTWLACDGRALSRTAYAALWGVIGSTFGAGDGSTTFNLPDLRGRSPLGAGQGAGLSNRALGGKLGEEGHALSAAESGVGPHGHGINDPAHGHRPADGRAFPTTDQSYPGASGSGAIAASAAVGATTQDVTGVTVVNHGGAPAAAAHNVVHPVLVLGFIIRAL